jgi:GntR family transcriptional regulator, carbon starvation induced regulator
VSTILGPSRTLAEQIYETLKGDLLAGAFAPGAALLTRELLARYGCGISPLREANARLVGEGMLVASGHRGVRVPLPSVADLDELYRIRTLLECEALKLAIEHGDDHWEAQIVAACHRLERAPLPGASERGTTVIAWETRHREFHSALIAAAPAPHLLRLVGQLTDQTERYRAIRLVQVDTARLSRDVTAEHRALADATAVRDPSAVTLLAEHLERTRKFVAGVLRDATA